MSDVKNKHIKFLPWSAINAFMLPEFQSEVLTAVLGGYDALTSEYRTSLNQMIKQGVHLNGFRNATAAPLPIKARGSIALFEKNANFASLVLSAWCSLFPALQEAVFSILTKYGWIILPLDADRSKMPGFFPQWPKEEEFDVLIADFREQYPNLSDFTDNQISLMSVWISGRLPYELAEKAVIFQESLDETD